MKLRPYQERGVRWLEQRKYSLLLLPMGSGKTAICCSWIAKWNVRVLVVAPLRVAETVWPPELEKWAPGVTWRIVTGHKRKRDKALSKPADVTLVNYDNLTWFLENAELDYDTIIFDELTALKNWSAKRFKAFMKRRGRFGTVVGLTGTFTGNGIQGIYGQMRCIDGGRRLGKTLTAFRSVFMLKGYMDWDWTPRAGALQKIVKRIADIAFTVTDEEYADQLPPLVPNPVEAELPPEAREAYNELLREFLTEYDSELILTPTSAAQVNKLQQIADGFAYVMKGGKREVVSIHTAKLDALTEIIESQQGAPLMVVYKFQEELAMMRKRHPGTVMNEHDAMTVVNDWNAGKIPIMYVHPQSAGHGLNIQFGGNAVAWYGFTWSWEEYEQVIARLRRGGQEAEVVFLHLIIAKNTVDEDILEALEDHTDVGETFISGLKKAA